MKCWQWKLNILSSHSPTSFKAVNWSQLLQWMSLQGNSTILWCYWADLSSLKGGLMVIWPGLKVISLALEYSENASTDSVLPEISTCDGSKTTSGLSWDLDKLSNFLTMHCNYEKAWFIRTTMPSLNRFGKALQIFIVLFTLKICWASRFCNLLMYWGDVSLHPIGEKQSSSILTTWSLIASWKSTATKDSSVES